MDPTQPNIGELLQYDGAIEAAKIQAVAALRAAWIQAVAAIAAGGLALAAGYFVLRSARLTIEAQRREAEASFKRHQDKVAAALLAELLVFIRPVLQFMSDANLRASTSPNAYDSRLADIPTPIVFPALVSEIGIVPMRWGASALIAFYGDLGAHKKEVAKIEADMKRGVPPSAIPTRDELARFLHSLARNLADAIDGLNAEAPIPLKFLVMDCDDLFLPNGFKLRSSEARPKSAQDVLRLLAGAPAAPVHPAEA
jgi:hypothetical protein